VLRVYTTPDSARYRAKTTLKWHRLHRRLLYDARLQPKVTKTAPVSASWVIEYCLITRRRNVQLVRSGAGSTEGAAELQLARNDRSQTPCHVHLGTGASRDTWVEILSTHYVGLFVNDMRSWIKSWISVAHLPQSPFSVNSTKAKQIWNKIIISYQCANNLSFK